LRQYQSQHCGLFEPPPERLVLLPVNLVDGNCSFIRWLLLLKLFDTPLEVRLTITPATSNRPPVGFKALSFAGICRCFETAFGPYLLFLLKQQAIPSWGGKE
jgi:hypothetical protein